MLICVGLVAILPLLNPNAEVFVLQKSEPDRHHGKRYGSSQVSKEALPYVRK